jgi:hypothetical protein
MIPVSLTTGTTPLTSRADLIRRRRIAALTMQGIAASPNPAHRALAGKAPIINQSPACPDERADALIRDAVAIALPAIVEEALDD